MSCCAVLCWVAGKVSIEMYSKADGIEAYVFEDKIEDADAGRYQGAESTCVAQQHPEGFRHMHTPSALTCASCPRLDLDP